MENNTYSAILVKLRTEKGKSRSEVAKAIGVTRSAIAMYERGERTPKDEIKRKLAKFYGKSVAYIFYA
jgi:transcriptional regulator with XRE-family HTH domain